MATAEQEYRRAFGQWLRTGRWSVREADVELKFNPWHDPSDGRFTFTGAGRHYGGPGSSADREGRGAGAPGRSRPEPAQRAPAKTPAKTPPARGTWRGGGFTGGGGGSFGGAGATGTWGLPDTGPPRGSPRPSVGTRPISRHDGPTILLPARPARTPAPTDAEYRTVERNGYRYEINDLDRTRRVTGALTVAQAPVRSRTAQARAGGAERRTTDDGGHYIAARFKGPTEAFNHYAQDANVNRGRYRALEDQWARDKWAGRTVSVKIVPVFDRVSVRPSRINVWWTVDGDMRSDQIPN